KPPKHSSLATPAARGSAEAGKQRACAVGTGAEGEKRGTEGGRWSRVAYRAACDAGTPRSPNVAPAKMAAAAEEAELVLHKEPGTRVRGGGRGGRRGGRQSQRSDSLAFVSLGA
ncbi:hypothetical protein MC885_008367, partial [Smutsia gigantea]